jgi:hypothetical protein
LYVPGTQGTPGFYVKRYFFPTWVKRLRGTLRGTFFGMHRGQAEYRALNAMRAVGVPAVRPVAYGAGAWALHDRVFLITRKRPKHRPAAFDVEVAVPEARAVGCRARRLCSAR